MSEVKPANRKPKTDYKIPLHENLVELAIAHGLTIMVEYRFHPTRKWRFDWAFPDLMIAVEYDGVMFRSVGHMSLKRILLEHERGNATQLLGWQVYRANAMSVRTGEFFPVIEEAIRKAGQ